MSGVHKWVSNWLSSRFKPYSVPVVFRVNASSGAALDTLTVRALLTRTGESPLEIIGAPDWFAELLPQEWTPIGKLGIRHCVVGLEFTYQADDVARFGGLFRLKLPGINRIQEIAGSGIPLDENTIRQRLYERVYFYENWLEEGRYIG